MADPRTGTVLGGHLISEVTRADDVDRVAGSTTRDHRSASTAPQLAVLTFALLTALAVVAGCGGTASPSPTPDRAIPTLGVTASPSPDPPSEGAGAESALEMFFGTVAEPGSLSFHLRQEAKLENSGVPFITARYDLDVAGADFAGQASAEGMGIEVAFELVGVDERAWLRIADGDWNEADYESVGAEDVLDIWRYVASRESLELEDIDADGDYVFESAARMPYETGAMRDSGMIGEITQQVLVLTPDGVPVSLELWIEARGTVGQQVLDVTGTTSVEFSRWGEPITIEAPSS